MLQQMLLHESQKRSALIFALCIAMVMGGRIWQNQQKTMLPSPPPLPALPEICVNTADSAEWTSLKGIGPVLSKRIIKYRQMIKGFDSLDQLQQVYGLTPKLYQRILPQLRLDTYKIPPKKRYFPQKKAKHHKGHYSHHQTATPMSVNLNTADSSRLEQLPGIGPILSQRIIKYRGLIGYFHQVDQLQHIYGLSEQNYLLMKPFFFTDAKDFQPPKSLNQAQAFDLYMHASISKSLAFNIIGKRNAYGRFSSWEELGGVEGMTEEAMACLKQYFSVEI